MREDPYYQPQDEDWPAFEKWFRNYYTLGSLWTWMEQKDVWWLYWLAFKQGVVTEQEREREWGG